MLCIGDAKSNHPSFSLNSQALEEVDSFGYLGSKVDKTGMIEKEVGLGLDKASTVYCIWKRKIFHSQHLSKDTKMEAFHLMVVSVLLRGSETWTVTHRETHCLKTFQMRCLRDILGLTLWGKRRITDT